MKISGMMLRRLWVTCLEDVRGYLDLLLDIRVVDFVWISEVFFGGMCLIYIYIYIYT